MDAKIINACLALYVGLVKLPLKHMWIDYDKEADVLYLSFRNHCKSRYSNLFFSGRGSCVERKILPS